MKKLLAVLMALAMVLSFAACSNEETPAGNEGNNEGNNEPAATGSVYWLNFKPESDEALKELAKVYTEKTGVEVKIETAASGTYNEILTAEMDKSEAPTIIVLGNQAAVDTWSDYCLDLTGTAIEAELNTDAYKLYDADGKLCSIGYCYECYGIIVNNALLNVAGYDASEITDFESLKAIAEDITARSEELGFGAFTSNAMDASSSWRYTGHMINLEYYYEYVADPAAWDYGNACAPELTGAYMDNFRALYDLAVVNSIVDRKELANGGFDAQAEFAEGKAVFYVQGSWEASGLEGRGMDLSELTMIPYYCGVEGEEKAGLNCGTENYWAINGNASEEDIQATMDFMVWLVTDPEASEVAVGSFGVMPYKSSAVSTNPFLAQANALLGDGCYNMAWITNFQPNVDAYRATAVNAMNAYNADPTDANWETVVAAFINGWAVQYQAVYG